MATADYQDRRAAIEDYFDRTAADVWARLTSEEPVSGIRETVRRGREQMRNLLLSWLPDDLTGKTVLDAGCGWGVTGIWCAKQWGSKVISMDADPAVFPYLEAVAELNGVATQPWVQRFEKVRKKDLEKVDVLVGGDICFWDELVKPVNRMIDRAIDAGVGTIVIGDPERPTFHEMAARAIKRHGGELLDWRLTGTVKATGALLVIHND